MFMTTEMNDYGRPDAVQARLGLTPIAGQKIAAIITFTAAIENDLERALWNLHGLDPSGTRPDTDGLNITGRIAMLERYAAGLDRGDLRTMLETWSSAARSGFVIRNNIAHGTPGSMGGIPIYMRNGRWHGEIRKREFGDFWADQHTLDLTRQALAVLMRIMIQLSKGLATPNAVATPLALKALRTARSVLGEFADQQYNPSYEKY